MIKVGFVGVGNMGSALARAVAKTGIADILLYDKNEALAKTLAEELNAAAVSLTALAGEAEIVFLGVKPNIIPTACRELDSVFTSNDAVIVSMAAGVDVASISSCFSGEHPIIRIMPNTPVSVGEGMILWCANKKGEARFCDLENIMQSAGTLDKISEGLIDAASAIAGCGPAFAFMFIEALADGGVKSGLPRDKAMLYAEKMLKGAAVLADMSDKHPAALKDAVCSPGGSTIAGVCALEDGAFRSAVISAVESSYKRTLELGKNN